MSGTVRAGLLFGLAAIVASIAALFLPIPCVNFILSIGSVIALGWGAGFTAAKTTGATSDQRLGRGLTAGAIGGVVVLIGSVIALIALSGVIMSIPGIQEQISEALQQNPDAANLNPDDVGTFLGAGLGVVGFCMGLVNFLLMLLGGLIGGLSWKAPAAAAYVPAGGSAYTPASGGYVPTQTSSSTYTPPTESEGGARIYDPNDPNRPQ